MAGLTKSNRTSRQGTIWTFLKVS